MGKELRESRARSWRRHEAGITQFLTINLHFSVYMNHFLWMGVWKAMRERNRRKGSVKAAGSINSGRGGAVWPLLPDNNIVAGDLRGSRAPRCCFSSVSGWCAYCRK